MKKLRIGVFAYNWPHLKTQTGILNLCASGFKPDVVIGADPVDLKFYKSKIRVAPKGLYINDTRKICDLFEIKYKVMVHNSVDCADLIKDLNLDVGVILGARILKKEIIDSFNVGIINMHPGLLPENRGLDNLKWAVIKNIKQGVTSHLINSKIDMGKMILKEEIKVYSDDTLVDIHLRLQSKEQELMIKSLKKLEDTDILPSLKTLDSGKNYHRSVPPELEKDLHKNLDKYLDRFGEM
tara:strand:- start:38681 stop:39397 length:717 start_codon:yes stop_codon:yes gene_type:complete